MHQRQTWINNVKEPLWFSYDSNHFDAQLWVYFTGRVNRIVKWVSYGEMREERGKLVR